MYANCWTKRQRSKALRSPVCQSAWLPAFSMWLWHAIHTIIIMWPPLGPFLHSSARPIHTFCYASLNWQTNWLKLLLSFFSLLFYTFQLETKQNYFLDSLTPAHALCFSSVPSLTLNTMRKQYKRFSRTFYLYMLSVELHIYTCCSIYNFHPSHLLLRVACGAFSQLFSKSASLFFLEIYLYLSIK